MARLVHIREGSEVLLPSRCLVGRGPEAWVVLEGSFASDDHASITWTGEFWTLRDHGSTNGSYLGGERIPAGESRRLTAGAELGFGRPEASYRMVDDEPPQAMARELKTGAIIPASGEILALPDAEDPEISIFPASLQGGWIMEDKHGQQRPVSPGGVIEVGERVFRLALPALGEGTPVFQMSFSLANADLQVRPGRSRKDKIELELSLRGQPRGTLQLGWHGRLLVELARARLEDQGLPIAERGWRSLEELAERLQAERKGLNVATQRLRAELGKTGLEGAAGIIEVRPGARRLGTDRVRLEPA